MTSLFTCTYRGCDEPPVRQLTPSNCTTSWYGCAEHWPAMQDALSVGLPGATNGTGWVDVVVIDQDAVARAQRLHDARRKGAA